MRVLGVDPGLTRCGVGVVDAGASRRVELVTVQVMRTSAADDLAERLRGIYEGVAQVIRETSPDVVAVERVFAQHNVRTAMGTAQAAGVAVLAARLAEVRVQTHTPSEVKAAVTGNGRADKAQVATMVQRLLHLDHRPTPADASDALALAICHAWRSPLTDRIARATA